MIKAAVYDVTVCDLGHREVFSICTYFRKGVHITQVNVRETTYTVGLFAGTNETVHYLWSRVDFNKKYIQ